MKSEYSSMEGYYCIKNADKGTSSFNDNSAQSMLKI